MLASYISLSRSSFSLANTNRATFVANRAAVVFHFHIRAFKWAHYGVAPEVSHMFLVVHGRKWRTGAICIPHLTSWQMGYRLSREHGQAWLEKREQSTTSTTHSPLYLLTLRSAPFSALCPAALCSLSPPLLPSLPHSHPSFSCHSHSRQELFMCPAPALFCGSPIYANANHTQQSHACLLYMHAANSHSFFQICGI